MFKRMYITSFIRNILILFAILSVLSLFIITLVYRVPNQSREKLLSYICETGDLSYLSTPGEKYDYYYTIMDSDGNLTREAGLEKSETVYCPCLA